MSSQNVVVAVTGASRGLGLEFVKQFSTRQDHTVLAIVRNPTDAINEVAAKAKNVLVIKMDCVDKKSIDAGAADISNKVDHIDLLINNAAVNPGAFKITEEDDLTKCSETFEVNVLGPARVTKAFLPLLRKSKGKKVVFLSSGMGSITQTLERQMPSAVPYSLSKANINMLTANFSNELYDEGFCCIAQDPGHVLTDMGGPQAPLSPEESIATMLKNFDSLSHKDTGRYLAVHGAPGATKTVEIGW